MPNLSFSQCQIDADFNTFHAYGLPTTIEWEVSAPNSVECLSSDWQPSFFVNQDSLLNVRVTGEIFISSTSSDDDFVGFVFGYEAPNSQQSSVNNYYLFDWKKVTQHAPDEFGGSLAREGFSLIEFDNFFSTDEQEIFQIFWGHEDNERAHVIESKYGNNLGWEFNTYHQFELIYTQDLIKISIDGEVIFDIPGCYKQGLFGLYSFNQSSVKYKNVKIEQYYDFYYYTGTGDYCQFKPISFHLLDEECFSMPASLELIEWNFDDGTPFSNEVNPVHYFQEAGRHDVELYLHNTEGCIDTITKMIFIEPGTYFTEHPQDVYCEAGDQVSFSVEVENASSYKWYYKTPDMNYYSALTNNANYSGVNTPQLTILNVRPDYDFNEYKCLATGFCTNNISSQSGQLFISDVPIRAHLKTNNEELCRYDSTVMIIEMHELYQAKQAHLRFNYDTSKFAISEISTYNYYIDYEYSMDSNWVDFRLNISSDFTLEDLIIASMKVVSLDSSLREPSFSWDIANSIFIDPVGDTISSYFYDADVMVYAPLLSNLDDSIKLCRNDQITLNEEMFSEIQWSTGETGFVFEPEISGDYWVNLKDIHNCESRDSFNLEIKELPIKPTEILTEKELYCSYEDSIVFSVLGGYGDYLSILYGNQVIIDTTLNKTQYKMYNPQESFNIKAKWMNSCGESEDEVKNLTVLPNAQPSIEIFSNYEDVEQGEVISFVSHITDGGIDPVIEWYVDDELVQSGYNGTYQTNELYGSHNISAIMYSNAQCILGDFRAFDVLKLELNYQTPIYIPSVVTPNGDGIDDYFGVIMRTENLQYFQLDIFDLSGKHVFGTNDIHDVWNGANTQSVKGIRMYTYNISFKKFDSVKSHYSGKFILKK